MICPVCEQEGRRIVCVAGNKESVIVYHPHKRIRTFCNIATEGTKVTEEAP